MSAKTDILARIRAARADLPAGQQPGSVPIPRDYQLSRAIPEGLIERFCERAADYKARVDRVTTADLPAAIEAALTQFHAIRIGLPEGLPPTYRPPETPTTFDTVIDRTDAPLDINDLQALDAVVTAAAVGIAQTGTVILDGGPSCGRRALTLVPDTHLCLIRAGDIVDDVPAAVRRLPHRGPLTWVSGPSATSDIELNRVEGVHGPRHLHLLVIQG